MLSRHPLTETYIAGVEEHLPASPQKLQQIAHAAYTDEELQGMLKYVQQGWLKYFKMAPVYLQAYSSQQGLLSESKGRLLHGSSIVIPAKMRNEVLDP